MQGQRIYSDQEAAGVVCLLTDLIMQSRKMEVSLQTCCLPR